MVTSKTQLFGFGQRVGIPIRVHRSLLAVGLIGILCWYQSPVRRIDNIWSDLLLAIQGKSIPENLLLVTITPEDVINHGSERLSRKFMGEALARLADGNVSRVLMDFNLGGGMTSEEEEQLLNGIRRLGRERLAIAYERNPALKPSQSLLDQVQPLNLMLTPDADGRLRWFHSTHQNDAPNACTWLATGKLTFNPSPLDLRLAPEKIHRISLEELHSGKLSPEELNGKKVIIAHDPMISRARIPLPLRGQTDRGTVLALGTASSLTNYEQRVVPSQKIQPLWFLVSLLAGFLVGLRAPTITRALLGACGLMMLTTTVCTYLSFVVGVPTRPGTTMFGSILAMQVAIACRLRVAELFTGLLSGVLSPEEVWLWRAHSDRQEPVMLFDAMGHIKKANPAAIHQFQLPTKSLSQHTSALARQLMPSLGQRSDRLTTEQGARKVWEVEWPSSHLPLAVCTDITTQQEEIEKLQLQVSTDPLTGALNRHGFENLLRELSKRQDGGYAIFFLDMNGFKAVNDQYGHAAGDTLLKQAAQRFRSVLRKSDHLARFGGDEFAILISRGLSPEQASELQSRLEATLDHRINLGDAMVKVGVAAGFATPHSPDEQIATVVERADLEMFRRKAALKGLGCHTLLTQFDSKSTPHLPVSANTTAASTNTD